jgi:hypothetical protein
VLEFFVLQSTITNQKFIVYLTGCALDTSMHYWEKAYSRNITGNGKKKDS